MNNNNLPVVIDLDGTLIKTDMLLECFMGMIKQAPLMLFFLPLWLLKGKAHLKAKMADLVELDVSTLPYNQDVLDYARNCRDEGHEVYLATGSTRRYAQKVAEYLGLFDEVFSTDNGINLTGSNKVALLNEKFGKQAYVYAGNHDVDLKVWKHSAEAVVVTAKKRLVAAAAKMTENVKEIKVEGASIKTYLKAIRIHQWVKNALIFVPLLTSHNMANTDLIVLCVLGFLSYSLAASSVYVLNDLLDLESDRQHPSKSKRPFAAGKISILHGCIMFPVLLLVAFAIAYVYLPLHFVYALLGYYILTVAYSFKLKKIIMMDTVMLAVLYTMRIVAGTVLIGASFSFWILAFSMFIFLSLALVKRYTELLVMKQKGAEKAIGRGYRADDADMVASLGAASGYIAILVFALYVNSGDVKMLYSSPPLLWVACLILLYWISRVWVIAHRGEMHDDPIVFAVKDGQSIVTAICIFMVFVAAAIL